MASAINTTKNRIGQMLKSAKLMQVATSVSDRPHVTNVWFAYDSKMNLYFISRKDLPHSREIRRNPKVAGSIIDPKYARVGKPVLGMTFKGTAREVPRAGMAAAYARYARRFPQIRIRVEEMLNGRSRRWLYRIVPSQYMLFDEIDFPEQPRHGIRFKRQGRRSR